MRSSRLAPASDQPSFAPWSRAWALTDCELYWLQVSSFPIGHLQRRWFLRFAELLQERLLGNAGLSPEIFLQMKVIQPNYRQSFLSTSREFLPLFGLGRHPKRPLPPMADERYAEDLQKGRIQYDAGAIKPDYAYWFLTRKPREQLQLFFGSGGTTILFLQPSVPPPAIRKPNPAHIDDPKLRAMVETTDLNAMMAELQAMQSPFLQESKEVFAADLKEGPEFAGYRFVLPLLSSSDFFEATADELARWFTLFGVYLRESPEDGGVLLASQTSLEQDLGEIMQTMSAETMEYGLA